MTPEDFHYALRDDAMTELGSLLSSNSPGKMVAVSALSPDDIRILQATLVELLECKRILDQAR